MCVCHSRSSCDSHTVPIARIGIVVCACVVCACVCVIVGIVRVQCCSVCVGGGLATVSGGEKSRERDVDTTHRADLSIVKKHLTTSAIRACRRRAGIEITFRYNYISISIPDSIPQRYICTVLFKPYLKFCMCFTSLPYVP